MFAVNWMGSRKRLVLPPLRRELPKCQSIIKCVCITIIQTCRASFEIDDLCCRITKLPLLPEITHISCCWLFWRIQQSSILKNVHGNQTLSNLLETWHPIIHSTL